MASSPRDHTWFDSEREVAMGVLWLLWLGGILAFVVVDRSLTEVDSFPVVVGSVTTVLVGATVAVIRGSS